MTGVQTCALPISLLLTSGKLLREVFAAMCDSHSFHSSLHSLFTFGSCEFAESWRPAEYADMSGDWEKKKAVLDFAAEVLDIAAVVKSYYDIELNDTPVDRKVVREFKPEGFWDDFTFSSLHMLFNAFDRNLGENQVVLLS